MYDFPDVISFSAPIIYTVYLMKKSTGGFVLLFVVIVLCNKHNTSTVYQ
jgi:hypothetical protein